MPDQQQPKDKPMSLTGKGAILGLIIAYPVSYFFQSGALRAKVSLGDYIANFSKILSNDELVTAVIISFIVCPILLAIVGRLVENSKKS